jgi:CspA family cold shock protein
LPNAAEYEANRHRDWDFKNHQQHQSHRHVPLRPMPLGCPTKGNRTVFYTAALVKGARAGDKTLGKDRCAWFAASRQLDIVRCVQHLEATLAKGIVKWFNATKGYGFIQPMGGGGRDVFVHISAVERAGLSTLNEGQTIEYEEVANRGKTSAENLKVARWSRAIGFNRRKMEDQRRQAAEGNLRFDCGGTVSFN